MTAPIRIQPVDRPIRVQLRRAKGWRMPPNTVKVDRGTIYGNPFPLSYFGGDRKACVARFREIAEAPPMRGLAAALTGKNVACWCPLNEACHGDVWLELASGIAAATAVETVQTGSTEGKSPTGEAGDAPNNPIRSD